MLGQPQTSPLPEPAASLQKCWDSQCRTSVGYEGKYSVTRDQIRGLRDPSPNAEQKVDRGQLLRGYWQGCGHRHAGWSLEVIRAVQAKTQGKKVTIDTRTEGWWAGRTQAGELQSSL